MIITLIRHLPTEWNKRTWLQGRRDINLSPITEDFKIQISRNQQLIKKLPPFDLVLASTLRRTHQTAMLYGCQPETEGLLDELDFGPFEGRPKEELIETYGDKWIQNPKDLILGESIKNLEKRVLLFLDKYKEFNHILVFGHGSWIRALVSYLNHGDINKMNTINVENNACITLEANP
jgi:broad specificity phosphatase PhoE